MAGVLEKLYGNPKYGTRPDGAEADEALPDGWGVTPKPKPKKKTSKGKINAKDEVAMDSDGEEVSAESKPKK
mgnify:CR=1 FL=1